MKQLKIFIVKHPVAASIIAYVFFFFVSLPFNAKIWPNYVTNPTRPFDMNIYLDIAESGYPLPSYGAFFPVWPMLMRILLNITGPTYFVQSANMVSLLLFFISIRLIWELCAKITDARMATWATFLYTLNPNSIFRAIAYPESYCGMFFLIFLLSTYRYFQIPSFRNLMWVALPCAFFSSARPIIPQLWASSFATAAFMIFFYQNAEDVKQRINMSLRWFFTIVVTTMVTYVPVGIFFKKKFDNFWQPFQAHKYWDRKFGLNWSLFTNPKSVSGSDNVLTWDFQGFYLPGIILIAFLVWAARFHKVTRFIKPMTSPSKESLHFATYEKQFVVLFCLLFATAHSVLQFLTYPIFMSLARHIFTTPFFYIGATSMLFVLGNLTWQRRILYFYMFGTIIYLLNYWTRFGNTAWMG